MIESVRFRQAESRSQLFEMLPSSQNILLGTEIDAPREFFLVEAHSQSTVRRVGILSAGVGVKPACAIRGDKLVVGFNSRIAILETNGSLGLVAEVPLLTLFHQFIDTPDVENVLVLGETAVVALTSSGRELWRVDTDLVTDHRLIGTTLTLMFSGEATVALDVTSGQTTPG